MEPAGQQHRERRDELDHQHQTACLIELRRQARRPLGVNLEEGAKLALTATTLAASFASSKR